MSDQEFLTAIKSWSVTAEQANIRLDAFVRHCLPHLSRRVIEDTIQEKHLWVNGQIAKKGVKLKEGDVLTFKGPSSWLLETLPRNAQLRVPIVYEDSSLLIVDKPAGMATHGFSGRDSDTVANFIVAERPQVIHVGKSRWEPGLVHRLDRETSGLLLVAKSQSAFDDLRAQFRRRQIGKKYRALVWGVTGAEGLISYPIVHDSRDVTRMRAIIDGSTVKNNQRRWQALTRFRKLNGTPKVSLLEIEMETGVTHQIRVHFAALGHPIVGDAVYGPQDAESFGLKRHFLHAGGLQFLHPVKRAIVKIESRLPAELEAVLKRLKLVS